MKSHTSPAQRKKQADKKAAQRERKKNRDAYEQHGHSEQTYNFRSSKYPVEIQRMFEIAYKKALNGDFRTELRYPTYGDAIAARNKSYRYRSRLTAEKQYHTPEFQKEIDYYETFEISVQGCRLILIQADNHPMFAGVGSQLDMLEASLPVESPQEEKEYTLFEEPQPTILRREDEQVRRESNFIPEQYQVQADQNQAGDSRGNIPLEEIPLGCRNPLHSEEIWDGDKYIHEDKMQAKAILAKIAKEGEDG